MPKKQPGDMPDNIPMKARVLVNCILGKPDDVVTLSADDAAQYAEFVDAHPDAVAYAESLAG